MRRRTVLVEMASAALLALGTEAHAAAGPYDEAADAQRAVRVALAHAAQAGVPLIVVFGANWCGDCKVLDLAMKEGASAELMRRDFRVVKVDVGRIDRNVDIAEAYGVPLKRGIPAVAVLSPKGELLYATREGELSDARHMGEAGIHDFFKRVAGEARR
jgi:protein disulfide-isomerase